MSAPCATRQTRARSLTELTPLARATLLNSRRWARNIESAGEDPFLSGQYAVNFINGFEHADEVQYPLQASACCKHFVANELDGWNGTDRNHIDVYVPQQDLVDSYLPSFQACVEEGRVSGVMVRTVFSALMAARRLAHAFSTPLAVLIQCRQRRAELRQRLAARRPSPRFVAIRRLR